MNMQRRVEDRRTGSGPLDSAMAGVTDSQWNRVWLIHDHYKSCRVRRRSFLPGRECPGQIPSMPESDQPKPKCDNQIIPFTCLGPD